MLCFIHEVLAHRPILHTYTTQLPLLLLEVWHSFNALIAIGVEY